MPKELLLTIMRRQLFFELAATGILSIISWLIVFALGFQVLNLKTRLRAILPAALLMALYSLFATQYFSTLGFNLLMLPLYILLLFWITDGLQFIQLSWAGLIAVTSQALGTVFVITLCVLDNNIATFFLKSLHGNMMVITAGMVFPVILLLSLPKFNNISLIQFLGKKKDRKPDFQILIVPALVYLGILAGLKIPLHNHTIYSDVIYYNLKYIWATMAVVALIYLYDLHHTRKKAALYVFNEPTPFSCVMKVLRRVMLDEDGRFRPANQELPQFNDIFEGVDIKPEEVSLIVANVIAKAKNLFNKTFIEDYSAQFTKLTQIEIEVMMMISRGDNNKKIANSLKISEQQVENIITNLKINFGVDDEFLLGAYIILLDGASNNE